VSSIGEPESGPATAVKALDRLVGQVGDQVPVADPRHRVLGVHVDAAEAGGWHPLEGVHDRLADLAQRRDRRFALLAVADAGGVDRQQRSAADRLRHVGERRRREEADDRGDVLRDAGRPVAIGAHRVAADLGREEEGAGVELGDRQQLDLQRGDDLA
jgi:hypothetical protein